MACGFDDVARILDAPKIPGKENRTASASVWDCVAGQFHEVWNLSLPETPRETCAAPFRSRFMVVDNFLPSAQAQGMRAAIEAHFGQPHQHSAKTHMVWNYWHVPGLYTYLRTVPELVIGAELTQAFQSKLVNWSRNTLGLGAATSSYLSLYVNGCRQVQHNDAANGRFGFVYFLTKNSRKTCGGETLIWHEADYFENRMHRPCAGDGFYDSVVPSFNRLLVFDDRVPHAVQIVEGNMDPLEGRIVLHGHISEAGPLVDGTLAKTDVSAIAQQLAATLSKDLGESLALYHGIAAIRFTVRDDGTPFGAHLILDRVKRLRGQGPGVQELLSEVVRRISAQRFPVGHAESVVTIPFGFG